jgi:hypothetical protein
MIMKKLSRLLERMFSSLMFGELFGLVILLIGIAAIAGHWRAILVIVSTYFGLMLVVIAMGFALDRFGK